MLGWIPLLPLIGFVINGVWYALGQTGPKQKPVSTLVAGTIASLAILSSFAVSVLCFFQLKGLPHEGRVLESTFFSWITAGTFHIDFAFRMDPLTAVFCLVITGVGSLIHLYSMGYMDHEETPARYFSYLNLFCAAMLVLVLGSSLPVLFMGWEGVGLCSYLLIGYWYEDYEKASAGKKAFIVNRIGDLGFLLGMFLIYSKFGTLDFAELKTIVAKNLELGYLTGEHLAAVTAICLLLFVGCTGKSAQIPLYVWLPDAMAGPTPVSALIHAATMVTSGIYLISRLNFLYVLSPTALSVVAWVGALTALFAATMAVAQRDIKKVLAYSTVSQLGYMFVGCGVAAFGAGVFHVMTHAFFKALLFLGAGSVIHGMHHEQDIMKMGGLRKKMPRTFLVFAIAWLAICGFPGLSGFFSKDEILWKAVSSPMGGSWALWGVGFLTAIMTAFYMTRLFSLTFLGSFRGHEGGGHKVHESPWIMVGPLMVLAILSAAGGWLGIPHLSVLGHWLEPVIPESHESIVSGSLEWVLMGASGLVAVVVMFVTLRLYADLDRVAAIQKKWRSLHSLLANKWYIDELYEAVLVRPTGRLSNMLWKRFDVGVIDRLVLSFGRASNWTGETLRVLQTGSLQAYAFMVLLGVLVSLGYLIYGMA